MPTANLDPMDRHILDLLARFERQQATEIASLEKRIRDLEQKNSDLEKQNADLDARIEVQKQGLDAFSGSLERFLAPPALPPA